MKVIYHIVFFLIALAAINAGVNKDFIQISSSIVSYSVNNKDWMGPSDIFRHLKENDTIRVKISFLKDNISQFERPLLFLIMYSDEFHIFQGSKKIYEYTRRTENTDYRYYNYHIIHLDKEAADGNIYIVAYYNHPLNSPNIIEAGIGEESTIYKVQLREQQKITSSIAMNLVFGTLSILAGLFSFSTFLKRNKLREYQLLVFGVFAITGGVRSINSYSFATMINMAPMESMIIFFLSIYILPVLIIVLIDQLLGGNTALRRLWQFNLLFLFVPVIWYFMILRFREAEYIHIAVMVTNFIVFPFLIPKERFLQKDNKRFLSIVFLMFYIYIINDILLNSNILPWEASLFIWSLVLVLFAYGFIISRHLHETRTRINDFSQEIRRKDAELNELKRKNLESQFEALKGQLTPHFLFNTLNTLSSVIEDSPKLAVEFVEELSNIYRYVLQCKDKSLIELEFEIAFIRSYTFILLKRHQNNFNIEVNVAREFLSYYIPPLTLQILLENVIKHNIISKKKPLTICVSIEKDDDWFYLTVRNNIQLKHVEEESYKVGLNNITSRYKYFTSEQVKILSDSKEFIVKVPLISPKDSI